MEATVQMKISLPNDLAETVRNMVRAGEYASESEIVREGLRALLARDRAFDHWLRSEVAPACDALRADPGRAVTVEHVRERLALEHEQTR